MRPVRSILATLLFVSIPFYAVEPTPATVVDPRTGPPLRGVVRVAIDESIEVHRRSADMTQVCRAGYAVNGCTDFPKETLDCRCQRRGEGWFIDATASLDAIIHLPNTAGQMQLLAHERTHIDDLNDSLRLHLESISSRQFDTEESCDKYARFLSTSTHLRVVTNQIRTQSNVKFGCDRGRTVKLAGR